MKKNNNGKFSVILTGLLMVTFACLPATVWGFEIEIPSSFNPVGSGARAIGMGGAFIAVADDATAASWNPGGLTHLKYPEISLVLSGFHRGEEIGFGTNPEGAGAHSVSEKDINYFSASYPFELFNYNMVVSLNYQHLYNFDRDWKFTLKEDIPLILSSQEHWDYQQKGSLTALGLAYCIRIPSQLSVGFTLNFWKDGLTDNNWEQKYQITRSGTMVGGIPFTESLDRVDTYSFKGINANLGVLWQINRKLTLGAVFKTPFKADVEHKTENIPTSSFMPAEPEYSVSNDEIEMPMSYGIGFVYDFSTYFSVSADVYRTEWGDYLYRNKQGYETCPVSGRPLSQSDVGPTHQVRMGIEYRLINKDKGYLLPIRGGIFYDPAPAEGSPDDFYGFSLGMGFTKNDRFSLDIAYQYRFGNDVGTSIFEDRQFSQNVDEHQVCLSLILYSF